jgi:hypothetical protein
LARQSELRVLDLDRKGNVAGDRRACDCAAVFPIVLGNGGLILASAGSKAWFVAEAAALR